MARERGTFNFSASLEIKKEGALDARQVVQTKAELIQASTWLDDDDKIWLYNGLLVCVVADTDINNGVYFLKDKDNYTDSSNWIKISSISGSTPDELLEAINNALEEAKAYTDDKAGTVTFTGTNYITGSSDLTEAVVELDDQLKNVRDTYLPLSGGKMTGIIRIPYNGLQTSTNNSLIFFNETELWYGSLPYKAVFDTSNTDMIHRKYGVNHIIYDESNFIAGTDYLAPGAVTIADISDLGSTWDSYLKAGVYNRNITVNGTSYPVMTDVSGATAINIYAPKTAGTSGQFLKSTGGTPSWNNITVADISNLNSTWDTFMTGSNLATRNILINGSAWTVYSSVGTDTARIYAPTTISTNSNQVLVGSSTNIPVWDYPKLIKSYTGNRVSSLVFGRNSELGTLMYTRFDIFSTNASNLPGTDSISGDQINDGVVQTYFWDNTTHAVQLALDIDGTGVAYRSYNPSDGTVRGGWKFLASTSWTNTQLDKYLPLTGGNITGSVSVASMVSADTISATNQLTAVNGLVNTLGVGTMTISEELTVQGNTTLGNVTITGNITQQGDSFITEAETVLVKDNLLVLNNGEAGAGVTAGISGIEVDRGTETNYQFIFDESDDYFKVGEVGNLQTVLTRDTDANLTNNKFFYWDNTTKQAKTRDVAISDISGLQTDGDGSLYLANDGTYKDVSASSEQEIYTIVPSETANTANASVFTLLKNNSNIVVVYKDNDLFFPVFWSYTATNTFMGSAMTYNYVSSPTEIENYDWISYDIDLNSDGVCHCIQRSLQKTFSVLGIFSFIYPSDNVTATAWNASLYSVVNPTIGYAVVTEIEDDFGRVYNKHIGKLTKTSDNVTIVCTEGNTQITYVCTPDGNITKQEADITIDWSNIESKPTIPSAYTLPIASTDTLGGIKVGGGLTINSSGVLSATGGGVADSVDIENVAGLNSSWLTLLQSAPSRYVTADPTWAQVTGKPDTFTPSAHTHTATEVTGLAEVATSGNYNDLTNKPAATTLSSLGVTATAAELNYVDGVTSNIQTQLNGKAASSHTHAMNSITDRGTITFTGAISGTYDGTNDISVNIPTAGGGVADSVDWSNVTNKPKWIGDTKPSYNYSEITGIIPIADIPTGTTSSTVALGNHTHNQYLTSIPSEYITQTELNSALADYATTDDIPSLSGYATQSWVQSQGYITTAYTLPTASASTLGGIKVGAGLSISAAGVLSATGGGVADAVDWENITSKPDWVDSPTKPTYTWSEINGKPSTFTPSAHTHSASDITSGTLALARIPTGTSSSTVALGNHTHSTYVPTSRTVNGKALSANISLTASDVEAAAITHTHSASDITSGTLSISRIPTGTSSLTVALGNHTHSQYLTSSSLSGYATQSWVNGQIDAITPASIGAAASSHRHVFSDITFNNTGTNAQYLAGDGKFYTVGWNEIGSKPSTFTPASHTHSASDITSGTLALARIPTGTTSSTVALGNHTHSNYLTSSSLSGYATQTWVNQQIAAIDIPDTSGFVTLTGTQTISGAKTFTNSNGVRSSYGFYDTSDIRLKSNIRDIELKDKINLYEFDKQGKHSYGVIAQEVEQLYPSVVNTDENGYKTVNYNEVLSIKCVELEAENKELKARLDKLETLVNSLL